jgi:hypothetical protein
LPRNRRKSLAKAVACDAANAGAPRALNDSRPATTLSCASKEAATTFRHCNKSSPT